jgi:hypothetical protein
MQPLTPRDLPSPQVIDQALHHVCTSAAFARAARARSLLTYLVRHGLLGGGEPVSEMGIGLTVFRRNPATYSPGDDPIVRVEAGRLRRRLATYYAQAQPAPTWQLCLPVGSYQVTCRWLSALPGRGLAMRPLYGLGTQESANHFASMLNDMLRHHLQTTFGQLQWAWQQPPRGAYVLEGNVRQGQDGLVTMLRLWQADTGRQLWSTVLEHEPALRSDRAREMCQLCASAIQVTLGRSC